MRVALPSITTHAAPVPKKILSKTVSITATASTAGRARVHVPPSRILRLRGVRAYAQVLRVGWISVGEISGASAESPIQTKPRGLRGCHTCTLAGVTLRVRHRE